MFHLTAAMCFYGNIVNERMFIEFNQKKKWIYKTFQLSIKISVLSLEA